MFSPKTFTTRCVEFTFGIGERLRTLTIGFDPFVLPLVPRIQPYDGGIDFFFLGLWLGLADH